MRGKTHRTTGLLAGLLVAVLFVPFFENIIFAIFVIVGAVIGSLFPDIDKPNSIIGKKVSFVGHIFQHRGFFHSLWAWLIMSLLVYSIAEYFFTLRQTFLLTISFALGYLSHLLLDGLTKQGVSLLLIGPKLQGKLRTGGFIDKLIFGSFLLLSGALFVIWLV